MSLKKFFILILFLGSTCSAFCSGDSLRCRFYFRVGSSTPDLSWRDNGSRLEAFLSGVRSEQEHSVLRRVILSSGASPEGNSASNRQLADARLASLRSLIRQRLSLPDSIFACIFLGEDWEGLTSLVEASAMPHRDEVLRILRENPTRNGAGGDTRKRQLMNLHGGSAWRYMAEHFFPELRDCSVIECEFEPASQEQDGDKAAQEQRDTVGIGNSAQASVPDSVSAGGSSVNDWKGLAALVKASDMPHRDEVLRIINDHPGQGTAKGAVDDSRKWRLKNLHGGSTWRYMTEHFFPKLHSRSAGDAASYRSSKGDGRGKTLSSDSDRRTLRSPSSSASHVLKPFYMGLKTNLLYDALLVPNIGVEFYLGDDWSVSANWMYAWWWKDSRHRYWRVYGGELSFRKYFGLRASKKPLSGHHIGIYGQLFTYDFETGGKGYMGGKPGGTLWEKCNYALGAEYGYSLPVARRLNLDFVIGAGYWGGEYQIYVPEGEWYVWKETRQRHWFGPTKAEVSLVWLLGYGNYNKKQGGRL